MKGKIFIIEDEASIVQLVQHNLEKEGFVVSSSLNGNEGLKELKKFEPNLLLLDWMLPDLSGIDICKNIRREAFSYFRTNNFVDYRMCSKWTWRGCIYRYRNYRRRER